MLQKYWYRLALLTLLALLITLALAACMEAMSSPPPPAPAPTAQIQRTATIAPAATRAAPGATQTAVPACPAPAIPPQNQAIFYEGRNAACPDLVFASWGPGFGDSGWIAHDHMLLAGIYERLDERPIK
jgi:hypothetical protein